MYIISYTKLIKVFQIHVCIFYFVIKWCILYNYYYNFYILFMNNFEFRLYFITKTFVFCCGESNILFKQLFQILSGAKKWRRKYYYYSIYSKKYFLQYSSILSSSHYSDQNLALDGIFKEILDCFSKNHENLLHI